MGCKPLTWMIPAKAGIQVIKTGFRIRSGMTEMGKVIIATVHHYTALRR